MRVVVWSPAGNQLAWNASTDASVSGYYVYRSTSIDGPYTLLNATPVAGTSYLDASATSPAGQFYMVRATKLESTPSGSYWNLSLGVYSAPVVVAASFHSQDRPHNVEITFSHDVGASLTATDLIIGGNRYDFTTNQMVPASFVPGVDFHLDSYNPTTRTARIQFDLQNELGIAQLLPSGRYTISFAGNAITNDNGVAVDTAYSFPLAFLSGDTNGDFTVDFDDLLIVAQQYGNSVSSSPFASGDFNDDGVVNFDDLLVLAQHYNVSI